ncbi:MAG: tripartite tricarboxylate transporter TctB family protein [Deltaproteobacteria bacterium]|nr:tripartite tricarboxylate transporter TctB family protein [Deltaproteobacteria bacterium]
MKIKGSMIYSFILLAIFTLGLYLSSGWDMKARLFPQLIVIIGILLSLYLVVKETIHANAPKEGGEKNSNKDSLKKALKPEKRGNTLESEIKMIMWVLVYLGMIIFFGFWVAIVTFVPLFMLTFGREKWKIVSAYTVGIWLAIYLIFWVAMKIPIYGGLLGLSWD